MIEQHPEEMEELAAGFALGALEPADEERFLAHLAGCTTCPLLVAEYRAVAAVLPEALDDEPVSAGVKGRILEAARREPRDGAATVTPISAPRPRREWTRQLSLLAIAAALALVVGLGLWNLRLQQQLQATTAATVEQQRVFTALAAGGEAWPMKAAQPGTAAGGVVVRDPQSGDLILYAENLPPLPQDKAYEAWVSRGDGMAPAGVVGPGSRGSFTLPLEGTPQGGNVVAVSVEPAGGSPAPTGPVVLVTELT